MSLLTDTNIKEILCTEEVCKDNEKLKIYPYSEKSLTPIGYDLRVGGKYSSAFKPGRKYLKENEIITLKSSDTIACRNLQ